MDIEAPNAAPDALGDRMKEYEAHETSRRFLPGLPVCARIDGRGFSQFTKDMARPYDEAMSRTMIETTRVLVDKTHALCGYTQSDEISLVFQAKSPEGDIFFAGKVMKMASVLAGLATSAFTIAMIEHFPNWRDLLDRMPHFDARVWQVPSEAEATNVFLWRNLDATKNATSMAARAFYSHTKLHGKRREEMNEMLFAKGVNFNNYPEFFKRGTFLRRTNIERCLNEEELARIPAKHRPSPDQTFIRSEVQVVPMPPLSKVTNRVQVIFEGAEPILSSDTRTDP